MASIPDPPRILSDSSTETVVVPTGNISREHPPAFPPLTRELLPVFAEYVASDEATRLPATAVRQRRPLRGEYIRYEPAQGFRVSDRTVRIYVTVRAYEELGETNHEACRAAAILWGHRLGKSRRGRPRTTPRPIDFLDTVQTVRSVYNHVLSRNPFTAARPRRDMLYETWLGQFWLWDRWVSGLLLGAVLKGYSGRAFGEELQSRPDTDHTYRALTRISKTSLCTILVTVVRQYRWPKADRVKLSPSNIRRFIRSFLESF